ncbi:MAG: peptide-methionine (S)-S-oxide reductase MsrA [Kofleriaceae bacterium]|nr:peptide-methionine (S)-S-oxide reductase MsrA [Kofleriaceae bacterium]
MRRSSLAFVLALASCAPAAHADEAPREVALLAGGCFWGMEHVLRGAPGIIDIEVGYAGGARNRATYEQVTTGTTGHAETVRVVFDPSKLSYEDLLAKWYFRGHDPTQLNRQGNDVGTQYRSEIFTTSEAQARTAQAVKARVDASRAWGRPVVTKIEPATTWVRAEDYHQDYLIRHPDGYNDHYLRPFVF